MRRSLFAFATILVIAALAIGCGTPVASTEPGVAMPALGSYPTSAPTGATTPPLTPVEQLGVTGVPLTIDIDQYRLIVDGLVEQPLTLTYEEILALPTVTMVPRLECPGFFVDYAEWTGPLVRLILDKAGIKPGAESVIFSDSSGYDQMLSLQSALADNIYLAHTLYGKPLPALHGYPLRLVAANHLGNYWVKWLTHIEVR